MSIKTRSPIRFLGGVSVSGYVNDTAMQTTQGGNRSFSVYSGGLITLGSGTQSPLLVSNPGTGHIVIVSGPGRFNTVLAHQIISGVAVTFYDSNVAALSGVALHTNSGYTVIGILPANTLGAYGNSLGGGPLPQIIGTPFYNGLSAAAASGTPGFTVTWTPDDQSYVGP